MINVNDTLTMSGRTLKGKNRIRENGSCWVVLKVTDKVLFDERAGPWLSVAPCKTPTTAHSRWVHGTNDDNFTIKINPEPNPVS